MGRAIPCLIRIVAACPRPRLLRVCASHNKTFPGHEAFTLINPVDETRVPRTGPGTPQANGRAGCPWRPVRPAVCPVGREPGPVRRPPRGLRRKNSRPRTPEAVSPNPSGRSRHVAGPGRSRARRAVPGEAGAPRVPGKANAPLVPGKANAPLVPGKANAPLPPDGKSVPPGQRCDLAGPAAAARAPHRKSSEEPGPIRARHRCSGSRSPQCCPPGDDPLAPPPHPQWR